MGRLDLAKYRPDAVRPCPLSLLLFLVALQFTPAVSAQEDGPYGYAVYFQCAPQNLDDVDASVADAFGPAFDRMVKDGDLLAWGWVARHTGGRWDRELYFVTPTLTEVVTQLNRWREANARERRAEVAVLLSACPAQEEYIWRYLMGSEPRVEAPAPSAEFVTYYECDANRGERADEIVRSVFRPLLDAEVAAGALLSWSWHEQVVGGAFTRILIIEGASHVANVQTVDRIGAVLRAKRLEAFDDICGRHQDYLWTIEAAQE